MAVAPIGALAWEPPDAMGEALKRQKDKKKKKKKSVSDSGELSVMISVTTPLLTPSGLLKVSFVCLFVFAVPTACDVPEPRIKLAPQE